MPEKEVIPHITNTMVGLPSTIREEAVGQSGLLLAYTNRPRLDCYSVQITAVSIG